MARYSIIITTRNRVNELRFTLEKISDLIKRDDVECIVCDDGSSDNTQEVLQSDFPQIKLISNEESKGLIFSRNRLMDMAEGEIAISLDDDLHFLSDYPLEKISEYFSSHSKCAVQSFRIFWGTEEPASPSSKQIPEVVKGFAGGAHAWNMKAWKDIPPYPSWFIFHGEEKFATYHLIQQGWDVHYNPEVLTNHRVDLKARKSQKDYTTRLRRSIRSGWYLYFLFYPYLSIPKRMIYTTWKQLQLRVFKGDFKALKALFLAKADLLIHLPKLIKNRKSFKRKDFSEFLKLPEVKLYWTPEDE